MDHTVRALALSMPPLATLACGCDGSSRADRVVKYAARSPDGRVDARIVVEGFGATVADVSSIELANDKGEPREVLRADHVSNLKIRWMDDGNLEIAMDCGRVFHYTNFFYVQEIQGGANLSIKNVNLKNSSLCASSSSPAGA